MGQLRRRRENQIAAEFNFPSDPVDSEPAKIWQLPQHVVLDTIRALIANEDLRKAFGAGLKEEGAQLDFKRVALIMLQTVPETIERLVVMSMREEDVEEAVQDLRELPWNDFVSVVAIMFSINFPGGVQGFLSLWERVTGLPLTSLMQAAIDRQNGVEKAPDTTSTVESSRSQPTTKGTFVDEEDILSGRD